MTCHATPPPWLIESSLGRYDPHLDRQQVEGIGMLFSNCNCALAKTLLTQSNSAFLYTLKYVKIKGN